MLCVLSSYKSFFFKFSASYCSNKIVFLSSILVNGLYGNYFFFSFSIIELRLEFHSSPKEFSNLLTAVKRKKKNSWMSLHESILNRPTIFSSRLSSHDCILVIGYLHSLFGGHEVSVFEANGISRFPQWRFSIAYILTVDQKFLE